MNTYTVKTRFVFDGLFYVKAGNKTLARKLVAEQCGFASRGNIHSTADRDAVDWEFPCHPDKIVLGIRKGGPS
jgi:hypothetical protein